MFNVTFFVFYASCHQELASNPKYRVYKDTHTMFTVLSIIPKEK